MQVLYKNEISFVYYPTKARKRPFIAIITVLSHFVEFLEVLRKIDKFFMFF